MAVKTTTEKNFRRAKVKPVKPVKKRAGARWLSWRAAVAAAVLAVALYSGYRATNLVLSASSLQVAKIAVHGNHRLSTGEIQALLDGLRGSSILTADLAEYRQRLLESPWVADVALHRVLPSTVEVFVSERKPIGLCRLGSELYLLDRSGTIIDEFGPRYAEFNLPVIDGVVRDDRPGETLIDERRTELAARVIDAVAPHKHLASRLSQIDGGDLHDAVVLLDGDAAFLHVGNEQFAARLQMYVEMAAALRSEAAAALQKPSVEIDYADLRFGDRVYVRPAGSAVMRAVRKPAGN